jgi:phosphatidylserine decarboxylase
MTLPARAVRIHPTDNVLVLTQTVQPGDAVVIDGTTVRMDRILTLGHKLAARPIREGEQILKYGLPIGTALAPIALGEHVHTHNMRSDYLPTYTHEKGREFGKGE